MTTRAGSPGAAPSRRPLPALETERASPRRTPRFVPCSKKAKPPNSWVGKTGENGLRGDALETRPQPEGGGERGVAPTTWERRELTASNCTRITRLFRAGSGVLAGVHLASKHEDSALKCKRVAEHVKSAFCPRLSHRYDCPEELQRCTVSYLLLAALVFRCLFTCQLHSPSVESETLREANWENK